MIPSRRWFPLAIQERAAWYDNFNRHIQVMGLTLGLTAAELLQIDEDNQAMQFLANAAARLKAYQEAIHQYRIIITEGEIGKTTPPFPAAPSLSLPVSIPTGVFERLVDVYLRRILASGAFTDEHGVLLGIIPVPGSVIPDKGPIEQLKPVIQASESFRAYEFNVDVLRLGMPAFKVQIQRQGASMWLDAAFANDNPCTVNVAPTTPGQPERILVRAHLMKYNEIVGIPSDATYVTINP